MKIVQAPATVPGHAVGSVAVIVAVVAATVPGHAIGCVAAAVVVVVDAAATAFAAQRDRRVGITKMHLRCLHVGGIPAPAPIPEKSPTQKQNVVFC